VTPPQSGAIQLTAVVPAAGSGSRMRGDTPKQYLMLCGRSVLERTVRALLAYPRIDRVVVGVASDDDRWCGLSLASHPRVQMVEGGDTRAQTVMNCLQSINGQVPDDRWALVHDAARPLIDNRMLERLFHSAIKTDDGALLAQPAVDTIKRAQSDADSGDENHVRKTLDRATIWAAQTPQMFPASVLLRALAQAHRQRFEITDESSAMEFAGFKPRLVKGSALNIKITYPHDLPIAEMFYQTVKRD